jgi:nucleoid-associated protein YgaU
VSLAASEDEVSIHVVESGDSFWTISREHYGAGRYFNALAAYNQARIPNPQMIRPGMKVMVPDASVLRQRYPLLTGGTYSPGQTDQTAPSGLFVERGQPMYRVGKGDTLTGIAHKHLGRASRWIQIYGMNQGQLTNGTSLKAGMVLRLPSDASHRAASSE